MNDEGNKRAAAFDLCVGVMSHDPSDPLRQGYSLGSALIMAAKMYDLTANEVAVLADRLVAPLVAAAENVSLYAGEGWYESEELGEGLPVLAETLERFGVAL